MNATRLIRILSNWFTGRRLDWSLAVLALLLALLPARALLPWSGDVARIIAVPIVPLMHLGIAVRDRIRPPHAVFDPRAPEVIALEMASERYRTLFEQSRLKVEALERDLAAVKAVRSGTSASGVQLELAAVVGVDPTRSEGLVRINLGERHGVHRDAPVIVRGDIFAGVVASDPGQFTSLVRPASRCSLAVRVYPAEGAEIDRDPATYPGTVLKPVEGGLWRADIASEATLEPGQLLRVADDRYGNIARGMRVGRIRRILQNEQAPLARVIEVEPLAVLADESVVILGIDPPEAAP